MQVRLDQLQRNPIRDFKVDPIGPAHRGAGAGAVAGALEAVQGTARRRHEEGAARRHCLAFPARQETAAVVPGHRGCGEPPPRVPDRRGAQGAGAAAGVGSPALPHRLREHQGNGDGVRTERALGHEEEAVADAQSLHRWRSPDRTPEGVQPSKRIQGDCA
jgi:hypothetical protein